MLPRGNVNLPSTGFMAASWQSVATAPAIAKRKNFLTCIAMKIIAGSTIIFKKLYNFMSTNLSVIKVNFATMLIIFI